MARSNDTDGTLRWQFVKFLGSDNAVIPMYSADEYEAIAASQTDQAMGATGGAGDYLDRIKVIPATTSPGVVQIKDGAGSAITVFAGGASSVADLQPFDIFIGLKSVSGAWKITTGANVSALAMGNFL
jgi:hypothetical protein